MIAECVPFAVRTLCSTCAAFSIVAAAAVTCPALDQDGAAASRQPAAPTAKEPTVLEKVRAAYLAGPTTERLRVSVRRGDVPPRRSLLLVCLEPATDSQSIARGVVRAGRLLIEAKPGEVRATLDLPDSAIFAASSDASEVRSTLGDLLPPMPISTLDLTARDGLFSSLTPYAPAAAFSNIEFRQRNGAAVLDGVCQGGTFKLTVDAASGRIRKLEIRRGDPSDPARLTTITIEHAPSSADLGNVNFASTNRRTVHTLAELSSGSPMFAIGTRFVATQGTAADDAIRRALAEPSESGGAGKPHPAIVLLGSPGSTKPTRSDGAKLIATLAAIADEVTTFRPGDGEVSDPPVDAGFAALWQATDAAEDAAIGRAVDAHPGRIHLAGLDGVEGELARLAPGSAAAYIVLAPDRTILNIHRLEDLPADPEQQLANLLMSLLEAASRSDSPQEGR